MQLYVQFIKKWPMISFQCSMYLVCKISSFYLWGIFRTPQIFPLPLQHASIHEQPLFYYTDHWNLSVPLGSLWNNHYCYLDLVLFLCSWQAMLAWMVHSSLKHNVHTEAWKSQVCLLIPWVQSVANDTISHSLRMKGCCALGREMSISFCL